MKFLNELGKRTLYGKIDDLYNPIINNSGTVYDFILMRKIYMYPKNDYETLESPNPYVINLEKSLSQKHEIINKKPNNKGVIDLFLYIFKAEIYFFNWIEDLPLKRFGKLQTVIFPVFIFFAKILKKKIIWVLHNKFSHSDTNKKWTGFLFELMIRHSDLILTHSGAGIDFIREKYPQNVSKIKYIIHPVEEMLPTESDTEKTYDLLIWGTIHPYKGVIDFLKFAVSSEGLKDLRIMVSGICPDLKERKQLNELLAENIFHINQFQKMEEIAKLAKQSRFILFTYNSESILSSGSLMDSIRMSSLIIGPDKGAFRDLKSYGFIKTYTRFNEIFDIIESHNKNKNDYSLEIKDFCIKNSWELFGEKLFKLSNGIL